MANVLSTAPELHGQAFSCSFDSMMMTYFCNMAFLCALFAGLFEVIVCHCQVSNPAGLAPIRRGPLQLLT
jgi:hypothetical protein